MLLLEMDSTAPMGCRTMDRLHGSESDKLKGKKGTMWGKTPSKSTKKAPASKRGKK